VSEEAPVTCEGTLALRNSQGSRVVARLEPWADEFALEPGAVLAIAFSGPRGGRLEIEVGQGEITVYGWEGATMSTVDQDEA
jgi:hypothetical protein